MTSAKSNLAMVLRWLARATGLVSIGFLLLFLTGNDGLIAGNAWTRIRAAEWLILLFFPFGIMMGMALAWWREGLGAAVAVASLAGFYLIEFLLTSRIAGPWFLIFTAPAFLFAASWYAASMPMQSHGHGTEENEGLP